MNKTWLVFLNSLIKMPGAKIDRAAFLRETFPTLPQAPMNTMLWSSPADVLRRDVIDMKAHKIINAHTRDVVAVSAITGIPGGYAMLATIPADTLNYYYHILRLSQKLGYLYGYPDMLDERGNLTLEGSMVLTAFMGVMSKVTSAQDLVKIIAREVAGHITENSVSRILHKVMAMPLVSAIINKISQKLGVTISAHSASRALSKVVPLVSGVICGVIAYNNFKPAAHRLCYALKVHPVSRQLSA